MNSDTLDDPDFDAPRKKRKRVSASNKSSPKKSRSSVQSPTKKKRVPNSDEEEELDEGQEVVGTVVEAPKTGRVPPGQISKNTLNFLKQLQDPECNDRTWFKLHGNPRIFINSISTEPVYRLAEKEWKDFIDELTPLLTEADPQIPVLPPNDVVHRIYRDIRFSNDKTPYKTNLSASFSRSGRKGIFAGFKSGGSFIAAGTWCPGKNEIQTIRNNILRSSRRLRQVISAPDFVELYGDPKPRPKGGRSNIFGFEDELKTAPKGVDKSHKDIDLLKCRSFAVSHKFTDKEVLDPNFKEQVKRIAAVTRPFVHCLNDMMTIAPGDDESGMESGNEQDD
ncbi:uncharacterized protein FOMMEDRAFT_87711 [Fomitiporia mediterranea MF3/22]|uniref:uncharacterized protein n=1 Tax=Fomitiporia mediterranea (strain MF3/22) TaxID=694068 RepID=UPI000440860C|nr:uncharacterized protein FOMMEDRAFT_87711 [Fomitiporia mediterranea MF3/22]EJD01837.1 hypothetical protein FOMMEDRAFT_87711 [Fomitiporia mediterranea MF3/22]